jgi:heme exporter protein A
LRLKVTNLACRRAGRLIFDNLSFTLDAGEVLAVTGRNGAGKSSLLSILAGRLHPERGVVAAEGVGDRKLPECLHLIGHRDALKAALTARENLRFAADFLGDRATDPDEALSAFGLGHAGSLKVAYLSAGQRRRVALARLLVSRRPLWLLDEPTAALDTAARSVLHDLVRAHARDGGIIIVATHDPLGLPAGELRIGRPDPGADEGKPE